MKDKILRGNRISLLLMLQKEDALFQEISKAELLTAAWRICGLYYYLWPVFNYRIFNRLTNV